MSRLSQIISDVICVYDMIHSATDIEDKTDLLLP